MVKNYERWLLKHYDVRYYKHTMRCNVCMQLCSGYTITRILQSGMAYDPICINCTFQNLHHYHDVMHTIRGAIPPIFGVKWQAKRYYIIGELYLVSDKYCVTIHRFIVSKHYSRLVTRNTLIKLTTNSCVEYYKHKLMLYQAFKRWRAIAHTIKCCRPET
jgi:hypothetical protein